MTDAGGRTARDERWLPSAERMKAFTDAVVAIAMTLLILPLLDSVGEAAAAHLTTLEWLQENLSPILMFALSFVVLANFWITHHRVFARVERVTEQLLWITVAWMLTIVWLPVATAVIGQMEGDALQRVLYIGSMALTSVLQLLTRVYLARHPALHEIPRDDLRAGMVVDLVTISLFLASLVVAVLVPGVGYSALFLMLLTGPLQSLVARRVGVSRVPRDHR